ncbi:MAG: hypothetical protein ACI9R3_001139 [Verrucomicrobiales bacterium]
MAHPVNVVHCIAVPEKANWSAASEFRLPGCGILALALLMAIAQPSSGDEPGELRYQHTILPVLEKYCFDCHSEDVAKGDFSLEAFQTAALAVSAPHAVEIWQNVEQHVMLHVMPPPDKPWPTFEERNLLLDWIDQTALACDCSQPMPGTVTMRRLNRVEYDNTIRDLFGWPVGDKFHPSSEFPADDTGYGFDNIGDVLTLSPIMLEKYLRAADRVLDRALVTTLPTSSATVVPLESLDGGIMTGGLRMLQRTSELNTDWTFDSPGDYELRITAFSHKAGNEEARVRLSVGDRLLGDYSVPGTRKEPSKIVRRFRVEDPYNVPEKISLSFLNDWEDPDAPDPNRRSRNVLITRVEVAGPYSPGTPVLPESHRQYFGARWIGDSPYRSQETRARAVIEAFATAAYRRPVLPRELNALQRLYWLGDREGETFEGAVRVAMAAVLVSPSFLFREEEAIRSDVSPAVEMIDEYALASRLSYFLWSSMPDAGLFHHAASGTLRQNLASEVDRMLADSKARAFTENFAGQWLQLRDVAIVKPDPSAFPDFDPDLRSAMREETELLFEYILRENRSVLEFLNADYSFVNDRLARHYGLKETGSPDFRKVSLNETPRRGVLSHASFLTLTSNPNRTSPVLRGKWIMENILGTPPPPAPQVIPPIERPEVAQLNGSFREKLELHRKDSSCAGCHFAMDTLGFAFEHFDGNGAWRTDDDGSAIESAGKLLSGEEFTTSRQLAEILATDRKDDFLECFTERLLTYALGRGLQHSDRCAVDTILESTEKYGYRFKHFIHAIIESIPFQMRQTPGE